MLLNSYLIWSSVLSFVYTIKFWHITTVNTMQQDRNKKTGGQSMLLQDLRTIGNRKTVRQFVNQLAVTANGTLEGWIISGKYSHIMGPYVITKEKI